MKRSQNLLLLICFTGLLFIDLYAQQEKDPLIKQLFVPLLDSLVTPPSSCNEASALMMFDSTNKEYEYNSVLKEQNARVEKLFDDITASAQKKNAGKFSLRQRPEGNGPPGGFPNPGISDMQNEFARIKEEMEDAYIAVDKMNVTREKLKDDLTILLNNVNDELHLTFESDHEAHLVIINKFLKSVADLYNNNFRIFRKNMLKIDEILEKFDFGANIKSPPVRSEITNLQEAQITNLKFLLKITDEMINIGSKFYHE